MSRAPRRMREGPAPIGVETQVTSLEGQLFAIRAFGVPIRSYFSRGTWFLQYGYPRSDRVGAVDSPLRTLRLDLTATVGSMVATQRCVRVS